MSEHMTKRQKEIVEWVRDYRAKRQCMPALGHMADALHYARVGSLARSISNLEIRAGKPLDLMTRPAEIYGICKDVDGDTVLRRLS